MAGFAKRELSLRDSGLSINDVVLGSILPSISRVYLPDVDVTPNVISFIGLAGKIYLNWTFDGAEQQVKNSKWFPALLDMNVTTGVSCSLHTVAKLNLIYPGRAPKIENLDIEFLLSMI